MIKVCVACLAQLAERKTEDLEVAGSTPAAGSQNFFVFGKEDNVREHVVNNCKKWKKWIYNWSRLIIYQRKKKQF